MTESQTIQVRGELQHERAERRKQWLLILALLGPAVVLIGLVFVVPFLQLVVYSFWSFRPGSLLPDTTFSLGNYRHLLEEPYYFSVYLRTVKISLISTAITLVLAYPLARYISRQRDTYKGFLLVLVLLPLVGGAMIQTLGWMTLLIRYGVINGTLLALGLIESPIMFLGREVGIIIGLVQAFLPLLVLPLVASLGSIDPSLEDAARSLGASSWRVFREVVLPLSLPGAFAGTTLVFIANLTSFVTPSMLGQGTIQVFGTLSYQQAIQVMDLPFASAFALTFLFLIAVGVSLLLFVRRRLQSVLGT
jgi:putative spermidine/putrescine transport system permease protein